MDKQAIQSDLDGFHRHVRNAFTACRQAVVDELSRHQPNHGHPGDHAEHPAGSANGNGNGNGSGAGNGTAAPAHSTARRATASQVRAIHAIANKQQINLVVMLPSRFHVGRPEDLSITEASQFIDELKGIAVPKRCGGERGPGMSTAVTSPVSPNEQAQKLIGRDYISFSAMSTFQQCPLKFYFKYIEQLPEPAVSASLVFGGAIHTAVEHHFRELLIGNPPP